MLQKNIYYVDEDALKKIKSEYELIDQKSWYKLYQNKANKSYWRLDEWDKYQVQVFLKIEAIDSWAEFDDTALRIQLLKEFRGLSNEQCKWKACAKKALNKLAFCEVHAYTEMGIRE